MDKTTKKLFKKKGVVSVLVPGPGKEGKKYTGGVNTGRDAIIVGVREKVPLSQLARKDRIPKKIKGMETDVVLRRTIKLQKERTDKWRPAFGGVAVGHKDITYGSLTMAVRKGGVKYGMSCNHVLANCNRAEIRDWIMQPGPYCVTPEMGDCHHGDLAEFVWMNKVGVDPSDCPLANAAAKFLNFWPWLFHRKTRMVPTVEQFETNTVDIAIYKLLADYDLWDTILGENGEKIKVIGFVEPHIDMRIVKYAARTAVSRGVVNEVGSSVLVALNELEYAIFEDIFITDAMSEGGDSGGPGLEDKLVRPALGDAGAPLVDLEGNIVGVLFAGSTEATIYMKFSNVIKALELDPF